MPLELPVDAGSWCWARVDLEVISGQIGVGRLIRDELHDEHLVLASQGRITAFVKILGGGGSILIRNGALNVASTVRLFDAALESCRK